MIMLGNRIRQLRKDKKWAQSDLAAKAKISREAVGNYENNRRQPPADILARIAATLGVTADYLLNGGRKDAATDSVKEPIKLDAVSAASILEGQIAFNDPMQRDEIITQAKLMGAAALWKEIPGGQPAEGDPEDSIYCTACGNDTSGAVLEEYLYCPYCGQKF